MSVMRYAILDSEKKFDLIWINDDHLNSQVTMDIINSLNLLNNDIIAFFDDVIINKNFKKIKYIKCFSKKNVFFSFFKSNSKFMIKS